MIFLNATTDLVFKRLFGSSEHKNIVISFLNSILNKQADEKIVDVVFNAQINSMPAVAQREGWVDIKCTDQKGFNYIVEMQVANQNDYAERAQYYSALAFSRQLNKKEDYIKLAPVIFVAILAFDLFKSPHYVSHHLILDKATHEHALKYLEFHFIELNKFYKTLEEVTSIADKWIYLLKNADTLKTVPAGFKEPAVKEAFDILEQGNWSQGELEAYDRYLDALRSERSKLSTAELIGIEKGRVEGKQEGLKEGELKGIEKGELKKQKIIARELLDVLDIQTIAKKTGLSVDQVKKLSEE